LFLYDRHQRRQGKEKCEGLAEELEPLPETKAMVGADRFLILALVW
jgi:hypothetical protein